MKKHRIVITDDLFGYTDEEEEALGIRDSPEESDFELEVYPHLEGDALLRAVKEADGVLVNQVSLDGETIRAMERCRVISRYGVGYDNVDTAAAREQGIPVAIVPGYCRWEAAEHAAALLYACARSIPHRDQAVRAGVWRNGPSPKNHRIRGSVLGIAGWGHTARAFYEQMRGAGFSRIQVAGRDTAKTAEALAGMSGGERLQAVSWEEMLRQADYLSLHVPLTEQTFRMIRRETLELMKKSAVLINTSRGGVIDEAALVDALRHGQIRAAGLDVLEREEPATENPLFKLPNVVLSDHRAYYSEESLSDLKRRTAANALRVFRGEEPEGLAGV